MAPLRADRFVADGPRETHHCSRLQAQAEPTERILRALNASDAAPLL